MAVRVVPSNRIDAALLAVRLVAGSIFIAHGAQKLFSMGIGALTSGFAQTGIPVPAFTAPAISLLEFFGGMALIVGLLTRLIALGLAADMLGALFLVHIKNGFFLPTGFEFVYSLFGFALVLVIAGPGGLSVDAYIERRRSAS